MVGAKAPASPAQWNQAICNGALRLELCTGRRAAYGRTDPLAQNPYLASCSIRNGHQKHPFEDGADGIGCQRLATEERFVASHAAPPKFEQTSQNLYRMEGRAPVVRRSGGGWDGNSSRRGQPNGKGEEQTRRHIFNSDCCIWDRKLQALSPKSSRMQLQMDGDTMGCKFHGRSWSGCAYPSDGKDAIV